MKMIINKKDEKFIRFTDKNILVIGGAGFIGSHALEKLVNYSNNIISLDNYLSGSKKNHIEGVRYIEGDVTNILKIFPSEKFDFIFHFGEYSRVEQSLTEPSLALQNSYASFPFLLDFWRNAGGKLIYSGSSTKFSEKGLGRHLAPYTAAKAANTDLLVDYAKWFNLPFAIVYFYNVYGGRELRDGKYATVIGKFMKYVAEGSQTLPVTYPGTQLRYFTHVEDIVSGILLVALKGNGDGYGIGANESYSILDLCNFFKCKPNFQKANPANRQEGKLVSQKLHSLGWRQQFLLPNYIENFIKDLHQL